MHKCFITLMSSLNPHSVSLDSDSDPEGNFKASCILAAVQQAADSAKAQQLRLKQ